MSCSQHPCTALALAVVLLAGACNPSPAEPPQAQDGVAPTASAPAVAPAPQASEAVTSTPGGAVDQPALDDVRFGLEPVADLDAPTALADRPGDGALYVAERGGRVVRIDGGEDQAVLDISAETTSDGERGLLGIDFSPDGDVLYVSSTDRAGDSRLDAYPMDGSRADPARRRNLLRVAQPYANHNGGNVVTGPDGMLLYGLGDGGAAGDPQGNGQDRSTLLGALLRIDPEGGEPYAVPADNPFVDDDDARPEIWAYGLRNPWRFSFDRATDDLWIADVGQGALEEVNLLPYPDAAGANLGWAVFEGTQRYGEGEAPDAVAPVYEYPHDGRCSVTGGYVYRGSAIAGLAGAYLYGDFCDGIVRAIVVEGGEVAAARDFDVQVPELVAFGEDATGELYVLSLSGAVSRLVPSD